MSWQAKGNSFKKDPDNVRCYTCQQIGHISRACPNRKTDEKPESSYKDESQESGGSGESKTEHANVAAAVRDHLESVGGSFLVRKKPSVAKHGRGRAGARESGS